MQNKLQEGLKLLPITFVVIAVDQFSKYWVKSNLLLNSPVNILGNLLRFTYVENPGIAFGIRVGEYLPIITLMTVLAIFVIIYYLYTERHSGIILRIGLVLILGGAIGNLIDRTLMIFSPDSFLGVVDFIDVGFGQLRWYVFNVADAAVTVGIIFYLGHLLLKGRAQDEPRDQLV